MKITGMKIEKVQIPLKEPVKVAFATVSSSHRAVQIWIIWKACWSR